MTEATQQPQTALQRQIVQMAQALAGKLEEAAQQAPLGSVLDNCESLLLDQGRQFLRDCLAATLQQQADEAEKKGGPARSCTCGQTCRNKGAASREFLTAIGPIHLTRTYFFCSACRIGGYPVDARLGFDGRLSARAEQMITLAGVSQSFRHGCSLLGRLAGWTTCHEIIRQVCYRQSDQLDEQRKAASPEVEPFRQAKGEIEFQTDGTSINTLGGWREMKIGVFAKRQAGQSATADQWDKRELPGPTARFAFAAIEEIEVFAPRWWPWAERLGLAEQMLSVLGDGAEWIWDHSDLHFPNWVGTLDIYHSSEWLAKAARAGCGEGTEEAARWLKESRLALLRDGYVGLCEYVRTSAEWVPNRAGLEAAAPEVLNYFCGHRERLNYALRLYRGQPIGSGLIEGACKQLIGRRMKQTGAQWDIRNADRMALLCSLAYADALPLYFSAA